MKSNVSIGGAPVWQFGEAVSFDDVLLIPQHSNIESRLSIDIGNNLDAKIKLKLPVISSPMDTVTEVEMLLAMAKSGGLGIIHRYNSIKEQTDLVSMAADVPCVGAAVGVTGEFEERACALFDAGVRVLCIDVAHGHHVLVEKAIKRLKDVFGDCVHIMAGNVATREAFDALASWGASSIRVGIGGGSICSTRIVTGHGVPTLQSILDCSQSVYDAKLIADGGIRTTGDMVKALAAGADFVMLGSVLAGTDEAPGEIFARTNGKKYKVYRGMASRAAQNDWRNKSSTPEGVSTTIPYKGTVSAVLQDIRGGICSGLSYTGARDLVDLRTKCQFIRQSSSGQQESRTHILAGRG